MCYFQVICWDFYCKNKKLTFHNDKFEAFCLLPHHWMPVFPLKVKRETKATSKSGRINYSTCSRNLVRRTCLTANCNTGSSTWRWTDTFRKASSQQGTNISLLVLLPLYELMERSLTSGCSPAKGQVVFVLYTGHMNPIINWLLACWFVAMGGYYRAACLQGFLDNGFQAEPEWLVLFKHSNANFLSFCSPSGICGWLTLNGSKEWVITLRCTFFFLFLTFICV